MGLIGPKTIIDPVFVFYGQEERLSLDVKYIKNISLALDIEFFKDRLKAASTKDIFTDQSGIMPDLDEQ